MYCNRGWTLWVTQMMVDSVRALSRWRCTPSSTALHSVIVVTCPGLGKDGITYKTIFDTTGDQTFSFVDPSMQRPAHVGTHLSLDEFSTQTEDPDKSTVKVALRGVGITGQPIFSSLLPLLSSGAHFRRGGSGDGSTRGRHHQVRASAAPTTVVTPVKSRRRVLSCSRRRVDRPNKTFRRRTCFVGFDSRLPPMALGQKSGGGGCS